MTVKYICALRNSEAGGGLVAELFYRSRQGRRVYGAMEQAGIGVYDCIGALRDDAKTRCKDTVAELDHSSATSTSSTLCNRVTRSSGSQRPCCSSRANSRQRQRPALRLAVEGAGDRRGRPGRGRDRNETARAAACRRSGAHPPRRAAAAARLAQYQGRHSKLCHVIERSRQAIRHLGICRHV